MLGFPVSQGQKLWNEVINLVRRETFLFFRERFITGFRTCHGKR
jgi:hypothetical protein